MSDADGASDAAPWAPVPTSVFIPLLLQAGFSPRTYGDRFADLAAMNWSDAEALAHFLRHGLFERRFMPLTLNRDALLALAALPIQNADFKAALLTWFGLHLFDGTDHPFGPAIAERWPVVRALGGAGARPYFIAGDSHTNQYRLAGVRDKAWLLPIHMLCTGGSAAGLGNPASRSGYGTFLQGAVQVIRTLPGVETVPFLLQFGQVDIEFVHHFQRVRDHRKALDLAEYRAFCRRTAQRYIQFVQELFGAGHGWRPFIVSTFPPALSDAAWRQGYVNADILQREDAGSAEAMASSLRELEIASLQQRTEIHLYYNDLLRAECDRLGLGFIDSATPFLGSDGSVDPRYVVPEANGAEHHLDDRVTFDQVSRLIWQAIDQAGGSTGEETRR